MAEPDGTGGIRQYIRLLLDRTSLDKVVRDVKQLSQQMGKDLGQGISSGASPGAESMNRLMDSLRGIGKAAGQTGQAMRAGFASASSGAVGLANAVKAVSLGLGAVGIGVVAAVGAAPVAAIAGATTAWDKIKLAIQKAKDELREYTALVRIPDQPSSPLSRRDQERGLKAAGFKGKIDFKSAEVQQELRAMNMEARLSEAELTKLGRAFNAVGGSAIKASPGVKNFVQNIQNVRNALPQVQFSMMNLAKSMGGQLLTGFKSIAGQFGIIFSVYKVVAFGKASVAAAAESQAAWARLASTLADFGISLKDAAPYMDKMIERNLAMGVKSKDTIEIMATLVQLTGDYSKSLKATTVVSDLMVARHMTMEQAARAVGRAIAGDTLLLSRQGIYLDKNRDALDQLNERMKGELLARSKTLAGAIDRMSAAWNEFKIAIGNALTSANGDMLTTFIDGLKAMTGWVQKNHVLFAGWLGVILQIGKGAVNVGYMFFTLFKDISAALAVVGGTFVAFRDLFMIGMHSIGLAAAETADLFVKVWDKIFHTHHEGFGKMIQDEKNAIKGWQKDLKDLQDGTHDFLTNLYSDGSNAGPNRTLPMQQPLGNAGKIQAKEHTKNMQDISQLSRIMAHGDEEAAAKAAEEVNKKLEERRSLLQTLSGTEEDQIRNAGKIKDINDEIAALNRAQEQYTKRINDNRAQELADTKELQTIDRLGRVARQADLDTQKRALKDLDGIQASLVKRQGQTKDYSERWFFYQDRIDKIEEIRRQRADDMDRKFKDQVDKLHERLDLHVDEEAATKTLNAMLVENNRLLEEAKKIKDDTARQDKEIFYAHRARMIEEALRTKEQGVNTRIETLGEEIEDPKKRQDATNQLRALERSLTKEMTDQKMTQGQIEIIEKQRAKIQEILAAHEFTATAELRHQLSDANQLSKHAKTRQQAAELYEQVIADINNQLIERVNLTVEERGHLEALLAGAQQALSKIQLLPTDMVEDWKETWRSMGDDFIEGVADKISEAWFQTSKLLLADIHNIKKASTTMFQGMGKAFAAEIRDIAKLKVKEHLAEAIGETARGLRYVFSNPALASMHFTSAAQHAVAAGRWALLAGAASNLGGLDKGKPGGGSDRNTGRSADNADKQGPIIYLRIDGMDPQNPRHQQLAGQAVQNWQETTGGKVVKVNV